MLKRSHRKAAHRAAFRCDRKSLLACLWCFVPGTTRTITLKYQVIPYASKKRSHRKVAHTTRTITRSDATSTRSHRKVHTTRTTTLSTMWCHWGPNKDGVKSNRANFGGLVLGCINADFCVQILILQHFSKSTRLSKRISDVCNFSMPSHRFKNCFFFYFSFFFFFRFLFLFFFFKNCTHFIVVKLQWSKISLFRPNIHRFLSEFSEIKKISKILLRVTRKSIIFSGNLKKFLKFLTKFW